MNMQDEQIDVVFSALANPVRRKVLSILLAKQAVPASELAGAFDLTRSSVSEHLGLMEKAGLVSAIKVGRQRLYRLEPEPLLSAMEWLEVYRTFWLTRTNELRILLDSGEADAG
ncbi:transcriptional regulator [Sphingomonas koreensis]|uniref:Transcriptional regulator n=2 Tax=Sphingomonas koreensis TaxID=93064 RepID=A0A1L6JB94_9SPHN|nr:metalloregulator ArsR/SmtB family transcription factor [Sphingomonas koreensis]APR53195.1 hypothetical protein BRX40_12850 [Sphingomonas koreensis]RSU24680.1 transcriptional regulator [Sphingomonas koreensis]RSU27051.1 transcriptional regulator [Sphingomonas koreensis]RSU30000.1 transcriptional regulator [Sphingomonas koreensis]RSU32886.1 transcriptional regulator [Sphingomonas koreensis]